MNFLKMAQKVRHLTGVQGTGPSSVDTTGYDQIFLTIVNDIWKDIQKSKNTWKWMKATDSKILTIGKSSYTPTELLGPNNRLKRWYPQDFYILVNGKKSPLRFLNYDRYVWKYLNPSSNSVPREFTIDPRDNTILINPSNGLYTIYFDYHKTAQELITAIDVPEFQADYHEIIVYGATAEYATSMSIQTISQEYNQKFTESYDQLVREQIPAKIFRMCGIA